ncbi:MAG: hypothetical protein Q8Q92_03350, partial [bacterium]|nr:hypothetical protein [bacterium]
MSIINGPPNDWTNIGPPPIWPTTAGTDKIIIKTYPDQQTLANNNNLWALEPSVWTTAQSTAPVKARCYNKRCKNDARSITEIRLGVFLELKTYICDSCLKDLSDKIKDEFGIEDEEEKK